LQPQSFTDQVATDETNLRLGAAALSLSFVFFIPVLESFLISEKNQSESNKRNDSTKPAKSHSKDQGKPKDKGKTKD
jgi:hypothetical protein